LALKSDSIANEFPRPKRMGYLKDHNKPMLDLHEHFITKAVAIGAWVVIGKTAYNLMRMVGGGVAIGPILIGAALPVHIVNSTATVRRLVNMTALAVVGAQSRETADTAD